MLFKTVKVNKPNDLSTTTTYAFNEYKYCYADKTISVDYTCDISELYFKTQKNNKCRNYRKFISSIESKLSQIEKVL
jgi:hypothetical protein